MARRKLNIIRLLNPEMCLYCRFAKMADVEQQDGTEQRMIFCLRLDCDNWVSGSSEPISRVHVDGEREPRLLP
ncbi:MAG: hypothetical protein UX60_C0037G0005 [Berkelbacteria bacterium GW2011_GWA2_46_7]|uniref:Uncharacterized protein n=1 Tax=Berkelbacteria bacterium GW2011_GWA2_46_7 TaxID=1618335 RepID=A0A0G1QDL2_9BACT|nr:MAG: hypothetical protein UX60_C0037G0005 [Berkelbacteria bacterium GW2011_GWA2_46_7]